VTVKTAFQSQLICRLDTRERVSSRGAFYSRSSGGRSIRVFSNGIAIKNEGMKKDEEREGGWISIQQ
jgi:hypothetical protein